MPFSNQVIITMKPLENFSGPTGEFRDKMTGELKIFFGRKLAPDIWANLERSLWASVQKLPLFKQQKLMVQLKSMAEVKGNFNFKLYLTKQPDVWPRWDLDEASEDDEDSLQFVTRSDSFSESLGMAQEQLVPFLLLPPIPSVPQGVLASKAEFLQLLWYHCDGDFSGFRGKCN